MLIVENYAFEYRSQTRKTSRWAVKILAESSGINTIDDDFDPPTNWWAYPLKPVMGMGFGFLFGLLQLLGLIPFLKAVDVDPPDISVAVVAALAGLLTEETVSKLQELLGGGGGAKRAPDNNQIQRTSPAQAPDSRG